MGSSATPVLVYNRSVLITGVAGGLFFGLLLLSCVLHPDTVSGCVGRPVMRGEVFAVTATLATFTIMAAYITATASLERHELSPDGLASRNALGRWTSLEWRIFDR